MSAHDTGFMQQALEQAALAAQAGEVPVGAVVVHQGRVIGRGHNQSIAAQDITAHAEVQALRQASAVLGNHRLDGCTLYVTLEPCVMCSGAIAAARLERLVYGAAEPKTGAAGSVLNVFADRRLNPHTQVQGGVLAEACGAALQQFFQARRLSQQLEREQGYLREDALRSEAAGLPGWPAGVQSVFRTDLPSLQGLRLHALQAGEGHAAVLGLHGPQDWSAAYLAPAAALATAGLALVAPDLPGFGLSDKPKKAGWHTLAKHGALLHELMDALPHARLVLVAPAPMLPLLAQLATHARVAGVFGIDLPALPALLQGAPYPDRGHRAGPLVLPTLLQAASAQPSLPMLGRDWVAQLVAMGYSSP